jgi:CBS domain-containing protein
MRVGEICSREVSHIGRTVSVIEAARRMRVEHVGDLVVVAERGGRAVPVGVLTDRDVVVGILAKDVDHLRSLDVGDVMDGTLVTASEDEDVAPVLRRMRSFGVRRVPVVDARGILVGILSLDDVIPALSDELAEIAALVSRQAHREHSRRP